MSTKLHRKNLEFRKYKRYYLLKVTKAEYVFDYIYHLIFNNKVVRSFNFKDYLDKVND